MAANPSRARLVARYLYLTDSATIVFVQSATLTTSMDATEQQAADLKSRPGTNKVTPY